MTSVWIIDRTASSQITLNDTESDGRKIRKRNKLPKSIVDEIFLRSYRERKIGAWRTVGLECELPIVDSAGAAANYAVIQSLFVGLREDGFTLLRDSDSGEVVMAERLADVTSEVTAHSPKDVVQLELGYCTLELSMAPETTLFRAEGRLRDLQSLIVRHLAEAGCQALGFGMQPLTPPSRKLVAPIGRYLLYERFSAHRVLDPAIGADVHLFTVTASNQCHIDLHETEIVRALNVVNGMAGVQLALTANSSIWKGKIDEQYKASRESFYDTVYGDERGKTRTIGLPSRFADPDDYLAYLRRVPAFMVQRGGACVELGNGFTVGEFLDTDVEFFGRRVDSTEMGVISRPEDIFFFSSFLEFDARLSPAHGTLESRVSCQQPPNELLTVPALVLGVVENLEEAESVLGRLSLAESRALRLAAMAHALDSRVGDIKAVDLAEHMIRIARVGLRRRGCGEEVFLEPLERALRKRSAPADRAANIFRSLGILGLVDQLAIR